MKAKEDYIKGIDGHYKICDCDRCIGYKRGRKEAVNFLSRHKLIQEMYRNARYFKKNE